MYFIQVLETPKIIFCAFITCTRQTHVGEFECTDAAARLASRLEAASICRLLAAEPVDVVRQFVLALNVINRTMILFARIISIGKI